MAEGQVSILSTFARTINQGASSSSSNGTHFHLVTNWAMRRLRWIGPRGDGGQWFIPWIALWTIRSNWAFGAGSECPKCLKRINSKATRCRYCQSDIASEIKCGKCGNIVNLNWDHCVHCSAKIGKPKGKNHWGFKESPAKPVNDKPDNSPTRVAVYRGIGLFVITIFLFYIFGVSR